MKHKLLTGSLAFTVGMGFSALPAVAQQSPASTEVKPNVININVDDLGYGDIGCYGATKVKTPNKHVKDLWNLNSCRTWLTIFAACAVKLTKLL